MRPWGPLTSLCPNMCMSALLARVCCVSPRYAVALESLLVGHEDWVHSVRWRPMTPRHLTQGGPPSRSDLTLLTTSMDRTMVLWTYEV